MKKITMSMFPPSIPISPLSVSVEQKSFYPQHFQFQYSREVQKNEFCLRKSSKVRTATKNRGNGKNRSQRRLEDNSHLGKTKPNTNKKKPTPPKPHTTIYSLLQHYMSLNYITMVSTPL